MFKFRNYFLVLIGLFAALVNIYAQSPIDSVSMTFPKVIFVKSDSMILLYFDENRKAYEVPSNGIIEGPIDFNEYIEALALDFGLKKKSIRLGGVFTYIYPTSFSTYIRPYFVVNVDYIANEDTIKDKQTKWFSLKEALYEIKYPASAKIVEKLMQNRQSVWMATFEEYGYTNPVNVSKIKFRILADFVRID